MSKLSEAELRTLQQQLAERELELRDEVRALKEARAERPSAIAPQAEDDVENAEERFRTGMEEADLQRDQEELRAIEQARERLAEGTYGICVDCGRDIPLERLRAQPTAKRCIDCQSEFEKKHVTTPRYA